MVPIELPGLGGGRTNTPREVVEAVLADTVRNPTEAAYERSDLFERRCQLMDDWATDTNLKCAVAHDRWCEELRRRRVSVLRCEFEQAPGTFVLVVLQDPDSTVRSLDDAANSRTCIVALDLAGIPAVELDTHDRL